MGRILLSLFLAGAVIGAFGIGFAAGRAKSRRQVMRDLGVNRAGRRLLAEAGEILNGLVNLTSLDTEWVTTLPDATRTRIEAWLTRYREGNQ